MGQALVGRAPQPDGRHRAVLYLLSLNASTRESRTGNAPQTPRGEIHADLPDKELRWSHWTQLPAARRSRHFKDEGFSHSSRLGWRGRLLCPQMENAEFKLNKSTS